MNSIATSIFPNGSIQFPTGISGTIYFSDTDFDYISGAVVRSYVPTTISNKVNTVKFEAIYGMNPIFDGKKLSVIAWNVSLGATVVYIYDPFTDTWTHSNDNMDNYLPYTYSVSGDPKYVFFATNNYPSRVYVLDTQFATIPATRGMSYTTLSNTSMSIIGGNIDPNNDTAAVWLTPDKGVNWEKKSSAAPWGVRKYFASVTLSDGSIVMMGGSHQAPYTQFNDVWRSTDGGATWVQQTAAAGWSARDAMAAVAMPDDSIVLMGGGDSLHGAADRQVWHSLDQGATWHQHPGVWWSIRITHTCVMIPDGLNGTIVLMGGDQPTGINSGFKDDVWISTDYGESWTQQTAAADWSIRGSHTSVALSDGSIVLMGGFLFDGSQHFYNDVWRSTDLGINWTQQTASASWSPRDAHASVTLSGDVIVLFGGGAGDHNNETWISVNAGANWTKQNPIR